MNKHKAQALFFDFDGTLIDSVPDLASALNNMLSSLNMDTYSVDEIRPWVGNGPELLVKRALSASSEPSTDIASDYFELALSAFIKFYEKNICVNTILYPGVKQTIKTLNRKYPMAIITNKPERFVEPILESLGLGQCFELIVGCDSLSERKPKPQPLLHAAKTLNIEAPNCLMIGDSKNDILAAKAANMPSVGVSYGYNYGVPITKYEPDYVIDDFANLIELV